MNFLSLISFLGAGLILVYAVLTAGNPSVFLNHHAILIVVGGSVAASAIAFQIDRILMLFRVFFSRVLGTHKVDYRKLIEELIRLSEAYRTNPEVFSQQVEQSEDWFLKEAMHTMTEGFLDKEELMGILKQRIATIYHRHMEDVAKFKAIGKYPPAFGLLGTTLSMITLLQKLAEPGGQKLIGPAMALGLVATFYGLAISNLIFSPVAENLADQAKETKVKNLIIMSGVRLIMEKTNPIRITEELNSFLMPGDRIDWKKTRLAGVDKSKSAA